MKPEMIIGGTIIIINALPLILKKPKYLILTGAVSLMMALSLVFLGG